MNSADSKRQLESLLAYVTELTSLNPVTDGRDTALHGIRLAMQRAGFSEPNRYLEYVRGDQVARDQLVAEVTVGETYFFRERHHFELLAERVLPECRQRRGSQPLRIWSAGCSTGEEAYSLAMMCRELRLEPVEILATDISRERLDRARQGRYRPWSIRGQPPDYLHKYLHRHDELVEVAESVRGTVRFFPFDLIHDSPTAHGLRDLDVVLCRNVLLYFDRPTVAKAIQTFQAALISEGWLFLGASDPPPGQAAEFACESVGVGVVYRRRIPQRDSPRPSPGVHVGGARPPVAPRPSRGLPVPTQKVDDTVRPVDECLDVATRIRELATSDRERALGLAETAIGDQPLSAELRYLLAQLLIESNRRDRAVDELKRAVYLKSDCLAARYLLATLHLARGDTQAARREFAEICRICVSRRPDDAIEWIDGETVGQLDQAVRRQLQAMGERS